MPVATEVRIVFAGKLPRGEQWSFSHAVGGATVSTQADLLALVNQAKTAYQATTSLKSILTAANPSGFTVDTITGYYFATNGPATYQAVVTVGDVGSAGTQPLPNQAAVVVSLHTALSGRRHRGRIYVPQLAKTLSSGQLANADVDAIAVAVTNYCAAFNGASGGPSVAVASSVSAALTHVSGVSCDSKVDTQRRRSKKEAAGYTKVTSGL